MRILVVSLMYPLPTNIARGTFVSDNVELLRAEGHEVKVINPLPRMLKYQETRRSTLTGVAKAPVKFQHGEVDVFAPRFWGLPGHPYPSITIGSMKRMTKKASLWLNDWQPHIIICHTIWPVAELASRLAKQMQIPWVAVVHGHDFDVGLQDSNIAAHISRLAKQADQVVTVSQRLADIALREQIDNCSVIRCHTAVADEWLTEPKNWRGRWRKEKLDILFPADPRRPEKNHYLALQTGEVLENRGWIIGITTLRQQPRTIVWDRMLVANVTLITSLRESGPLVARESLACGTPVVSVDVGDIKDYLPEFCFVEDYNPVKLADAIELALQHDWQKKFDMPEVYSFYHVSNQWQALLSNLVEQT
ncbi:MAG: glycosyltransferase [Candidatus Thermoplasmatota archaeon]|nr:glycosyltransferase [Candidatus Thermoplasmatota archaeon]